jgi:hypothetical protein
MATTTHTIVVKLSHDVVVSLMRRLFRETTTSFSLLALSPPHHQKSYVALHGTTYETADVYQYTCSYEEIWQDMKWTSEKQGIGGLSRKLLHVANTP